MKSNCLLARFSLVILLCIALQIHWTDPWINEIGQVLVPNLSLLWDTLEPTNIYPDWVDFDFHWTVHPYLVWVDPGCR